MKWQIRGSEGGRHRAFDRDPGELIAVDLEDHLSRCAGLGDGDGRQIMSGYIRQFGIN